jgi:hypothetical protein
LTGVEKLLLKKIQANVDSFGIYHYNKISISFEPERKL